MPSSYSLPTIMEEEIEALIEAGYYSSKSDVVKDAIRELLEKNRNLRTAAAVEMYKKGNVSLGRAAEIADMNIVEFKEVLRDRGVKIPAGVDREAIKSSDKVMKRIR
ncbi:MAG: UPF0175 family protein [Candidatus Aenigmarchaeota archaeon]|nr:UPF0175 family protein [Candidatus Aenigmarchaeota archaeon]